MLEDHHITAWRFVPWGPDGVELNCRLTKRRVYPLSEGAAWGVQTHLRPEIADSGVSSSNMQDAGTWQLQMFPDMTFIVYHSSFDPAVV